MNTIIDSRETTHIAVTPRSRTSTPTPATNSLPYRERRRSPAQQLLSTVVLCVAVVLATAGCSFLAPENQYRFSAGDGVNIEGVGPLAVRNVLVVANESGGEGNLVGAIVNNSSDDHVLLVEVGDPPHTTIEITVPAETTVSYGQRDSLEDPPLIERLDADPGSTVPMSFRVGDSDGIQEQVPVLDGCLDYLSGLEPGAEGDTQECPWYAE